MIIVGFGLFLGIILGVRYRVFAVLLASIFMIAMGAADGYVHSRGLGSSLMAISICLVCLQFGYIVSATVSGLLVKRPRHRETQAERSRLSLHRF